MRVEKLRIENLGPLQEVELNLKPVTVLMGPNEQGKSFIIGALEVLRFGTTRGIKVGENFALTHNGTKGWAVEALVSVNPDADAIPLRRTRSAGPDAATLEGAMGDARVWRAILDGRQFIAMPPAERKALVADLLARDTIELVETLQAKGAGADLLKAVEEGNLRKAFRLAEENRRAIGRVLADKETIVKAGAEDVSVPTRSGQRPISELPLLSIDRALHDARDAWTVAIKTSERVLGKRRLAEDGAAAAKELAALPVVPPFTEQEGARLVELGGLLDRSTKEHARLTAESKLGRMSADGERARLKASGPCGTCGQAMTEEARRLVASKVTELEENLTKLGTALRSAADGMSTLKEEAAGLTEKRNAAIADTRTRERLAARVAAAKEANADETAADPAPLEAEVRRLESLRETRIRYDGRLEAVTSAKGVVAKLREDLATAQEIEACCTPDRIDDEGATLKAINEALAEFAPKIMGGPWVAVTSTWDVTYAGFRVELASRSAMIRTGLVLALALSRLSGVKCVFADDLESVDDSTRSKVIALLGQLAESGEIETAIVATVRPEPPAPATLPAWLGRVWVQGGKARDV